MRRKNMFQARNFKKTVAVVCAAVLLAGGIPMNGLKNGSVMAANPDTLQIPALKVVDKSIAPISSKGYNRQEANRLSYDAKEASVKNYPMSLSIDSSKSIQFKAETTGVYGFEIVGFTQNITSVNMKLVNKDTNKTVKSLSSCKVGSHISVSLNENTNYELVVSRNSGKKGSATVKMGKPGKSDDFTSYIKNEEAGILEINDSVIFSGQKNIYTFTAEKTGIYAFSLKNIDNSESEHKFDFSLKAGEKVLSKGVAGLDETFTEQLEAGTTYTISIGQKVGTGSYTLALCQPRDVLDIGTNTDINDSLDYTEQENVYTLTAPRAGKYKFGIAIPDNDKHDKKITLAIYEGDNLYQISYTGEDFTVDLKGSTAYTLKVSYENCLTPYTLKVCHQKENVELGSGINKIKDSVEFKGQRNTYTFKAPCDGTYSFYMTDITKISGDNLQTYLTLQDSEGKSKAAQKFGVEESSALCFNLKGGTDYTLGIEQSSGTFKYTLNYGEAKPVQDITNYRYVKDSMQYYKQANVYPFTAPSDGDYRFQIEDNGRDAAKNCVTLTVSGEKANSSVFMTECTEGKGVLAGLKKDNTYKVTVDQSVGYAPYTLVVGKTNERTITPSPTPVPKTTEPTGDSKKDINSFVERIYKYVLDRDADPEGTAFWADELYSFRHTGAEVAQGFIFSPEFENRRTTDREFVTILYKTFFGRDADESGINFWLNELSKGKSRVEVANGFIYSQEWADTCAAYGIRSGGDIKPKNKIQPTSLTYAFVERMYTTAMGRNYDPDGRQYWASLLANFELTGEQVGTSFFLSEEMINYKLSDAEFLNRLYKTFMDRESDKDGQTYWLSQMASGKSRKDIVLGFTRSPEFLNKCIEARILPY